MSYRQPFGAPGQTLTLDTYTIATFALPTIVRSGAGTFTPPELALVLETPSVVRVRVVGCCVDDLATQVFDFDQRNGWLRRLDGTVLRLGTTSGISDPLVNFTGPVNNRPRITFSTGVDGVGRVEFGIAADGIQTQWGITATVEILAPRIL